MACREILRKRNTHRGNRALRAYLFIILGFALFTSSAALPWTRLLEPGWQDEIRLTVDTATALTGPNNSKYLAVDGEGRLHIVWLDERDRNFEIYHKTRTGGIWSADERLTDDPGYSERPSLAVDASGYVHLVWADNRDGNREVYYRVWTGMWQRETRVTETAGDSFGSCLAADGDTIHMVYMESVSGHLQVMYRRLADNRWSSAAPLTDVPTGERYVPTIDIGPDRALHVAWWDTREDFSGGSGKIYYKKRAGAIWLDEELLTDPTGNAMRPNIAVDDSGFVHVVWIDQRALYDQIYYRRCGPKGWESEIPLTSAAATHYHPSIDAAGGEVFVAYWKGLSESNSEVFFQRRVAGSWTGAVRISNGAGTSQLPCLIAEKNKNLHLAWVFTRDGNTEMYYREYIDPQNGVGGGEEEPPAAVPPPLSISAYPNPFRGATNIALTLPAECRASIILYGVDGTRIRGYAPRALPPGTHVFSWDARSDAGAPLPPGVYFAVGRAGKHRIETKLVLID